MKSKKKIELSPSEMKAVGIDRSWEDSTEVRCPFGETKTCPDGYVSAGIIQMWDGTDIGIKCKPAGDDWMSLIMESGTDGDSGTSGSGTSSSQTIDIYCDGCTQQHQLRPSNGYTDNPTEACKGYPVGSFCKLRYAGVVQNGICKIRVGAIQCQI